MSLVDRVYSLNANERAQFNEFFKEFGGYDTLLQELDEFKIKLEGLRFHGTVSTDFAQSLWKLQLSFNRFVAFALHNDPSYSLSTKEKERYQLVFKISDGSTDALSIGFSDGFLNIVSEVAGKMEGWQVLAICVFSLAAYFGHKCYHDYCEKEKFKTERQSEERKHAKLLDTFLPLTKAAAQFGEESYKTILKNVSGLDSADIGCRHFDTNEIYNVKNSKDQLPEPRSEQGKFLIFSINTKGSPFLRLQLQKLNTDEDAFFATLDLTQDSDTDDPVFSQEQIDLLRYSHWQCVPVELVITRILLPSGKTRNATISDIVLPSKK